MATESKCNGDAILQELYQPSQRESRWLIGVVVAAVVLRIIMLMLRSPDLNTDPDAYVALAETITDTGGFCSPATDSPTAFRPPLYPMALAVLLAIGIKVSTAISLLALASGVLVTIATWWMARLLGLRGIWPGLAGVLVAADPLLLRYSPMPMTETLSAALLTIAVLQVIKLLPLSGQQQTGTVNWVKSSVIAGVMFAAAGYCRPICFLTCGVLTCGLILRTVLSGPAKITFAASIVKCLIPTAVAGLCLVPWVLRNAVQLHAFVPLTTHGGYTLLLGNNDVFYRDVVSAPEQPVWSEASLTTWQQSLDDELASAGLSGEVETDQWMYEQATAAIIDHPAGFRAACWLRWKRFWALRPRVDGHFAFGWVIALVGAWYLLQWIGLLAAVWRFRQQPNTLILWSAIGSFLLLHTFYWTNTRMRAPLTGVIVVLAVLGWEYLAQRFRMKRIFAASLKNAELTSLGSSEKTTT